MDDLEKFVRDGGHLVKNGSNLYYLEIESCFVVIVDYDSNDESDFIASLNCGYYYSTRSFNKALAELNKPDSQSQKK